MDLWMNEQINKQPWGVWRAVRRLDYLERSVFPWGVEESPILQQTGRGTSKWARMGFKTQGQVEPAEQGMMIAKVDPV